LLLQTGKHEEGKAYLERITKRSGEARDQSLLKRVAETFMEGGLFEEAQKVFQKVLREHSEDLEIYNRMGIALRRQGKYEEAEKHYLNALKRYSAHPGFYHNLGVVCMAGKNYEKAKHYFKRALYLDPESPNTRKALEKIENLR
jgi:Tfp pilus assembly protein PilF